MNMDDVTPKRISKLLKEQNIQRKVFQEDLGFSKNAVSEWMSGFTKSYRKKLPEIAKYLNVSIEYLLGETDIKEKKQLIELIQLADDETIALLLQLARKIRDQRPE